MVAIKEVSGMFWGVTLDTGKRYTQMVERSFHISMAALEPKQGGAANQNVCVMLQHDKADYLMCTLSQSRLLQQELDLNFTEGEEVTFYLSGTGTVHLTGYLMDDGDMDDTMDGQYDSIGKFSDEEAADEEESFDDDDESDDDESPEMSTTFGELETTQSTDEDDEEWSEAHKRKMKQALRAAKKVRRDLAKKGGDDEDDDEDDDEEDDDDESMDDSTDAFGTTMESFDTSQFSDESDESDEDEKGETPTKKAVQNAKRTPKPPGKVVESVDNKKPAEKTPKNAPSATKKVKVEQKGQTPKSAIKQEEQTPKPDVKKAGDKGKGKSQPQTPPAQKGDKTKTPSEKTLANGSQKKSPADSSIITTPGGSKASRKRKRQREKRQSLLAEEKKSEPAMVLDRTTSNARVLSGGTAVVDEVVGHGPEAKSGKMLSVYYSGKVSGKQTHFDQCLSGKPFKFRLGKAEVIPGWETGLKGMKVGGKRTIIVPPNEAYGSRPQGEIPANSTLVFNVQLKAVS